ncbi:MAG: amidohydrolase [Haliscomenobacter sp.]|nr:amidohydrolase [Haliscomenobacter sp.]
MRNLLLLAGCLVICSFTRGDHPAITREAIAEEIPFLLDFYKQLHQSPELSFQEKETSRKLAAELRKVGYEVTEGVGGYGIVGILKNGPGPTILYRTDMDALPMVEKTGLPYASAVKVPHNGQETGTMHSCGHDMHMTTWLGTARVMARMKDQWKGTLMLIGQPAEELGAGSKMMLDAGLYTRFGVPTFGIGLHCSPTIPAGQVGFGKGYTMANSERMDIKIFGIGAHGASPHMSIDPVVLASMMIMELQTIVSRSMKPTEPAVVTVGAIKGGTQYNIIPDEVTLQLTIRTFSEEVRQLVHRRIKEIAKGTAIAAGLPEDKMPVVTLANDFTPANFNHPDLIDKLSASAVKAVGSQNVIEAGTPNGRRRFFPLWKNGTQSSYRTILAGNRTGRTLEELGFAGFALALLLPCASEIARNRNYSNDTVFTGSV